MAQGCPVPREKQKQGTHGRAAANTSGSISLYIYIYVCIYIYIYLLFIYRYRYNIDIGASSVLVVARLETPNRTENESFRASHFVYGDLNYWIWVVFKNSFHFGGPFIWVPYDIGDPERDPNLENYPSANPKPKTQSP